MNVVDSNAIFDPFRDELSRWKKGMPENFYTSDPNLHSSLLYWIGEAKLTEFEPALMKVGEDAATTLNQWAIETNRDENLPRLCRFDGNGKRIEAIEFHPLYHEMGRKIYGSKIMSMYAKPGNDVVQMAMFYLFVQNGEAGHCCPLACTAGAIKLLDRVGSPKLKERFLPKLLDPNYDTHLHASQFLTELQGGSDVGANATIAVQEDSHFRLYGEKWFCSVSDAGLMVLTARPEGAKEGSKGLSTFIAPRFLEDGNPNHFEIKRLKYKIGTRSMATAEIDLKGLIAYPVGKPGEGFKYVVDIVLNTSRLYNGFAAAGMTRRAYLEALSFSRYRQAFGKKIGEFPLIRRSLAFLRTEASIQLASSMHVAHLAARIAYGSSDEETQREFRFLVNANKYWTAIRCTRAIREAIEVMGGNGTIEEFSILPRLYRDAIVIESWEGTHNVLAQQILRDMAKYQIHESVFQSAERALRDLLKGKLATESRNLMDTLNSCKNQAKQLLEMDADAMSLNIRIWIDRTMALIQAIDILSEANAEANRGEDTLKSSLFRYHWLCNLQREDFFGHRELADTEKILS